jgi:anti-anti-sigma regulatory factor
MHFQREYVDDVVVLSPARNLWGGDETDALEGELLRQLAERRQKLVIDLHRTEHMVTAAIAMLQKTIQRFRDAGVAYAFCNVDKRMMHVLVVLRIVRLFNVCQTREEAIAAVNGKLTGT